MKSLAARLLPAGIDVRGWLRTLALTGGMQVVVQGLGFASGLVVVRMLAPAEYALYTIVQTVLAVALVVSDAGIGNGVLASGGRVWQDRVALGGVLAAGREVRRRATMLVAMLAVPATFVLLRRQEASTSAAALLALALLPALFATATTSLLEVVMRLRQEILALQLLQSATQGVRIAAVALALVAWPAAVVAVVVHGLTQWWNNVRLSARIARHVDAAAAPDPAARAEILAQVRRSLPLALHYAVSAQLAAFLLAALGAPQSIAAFGALGRLAMILVAVGTVFALVVVPRFARLPDEDRRAVAARYWLAQAAFVAFAAVPVGAVWLAPGPALAVLGPEYAGLEAEALLAAAGAAFAALAGLAFALGAARATIVPPALAVPLVIAVQVGLVLALPVNTVSGALWVALLTAAAQWAMHAGYFAFRLQHGPARA